MKTIGVIANCGKPQAAEALQRLSRKAAALKIEVIADEATAALLGPSASPTLIAQMDRIDALMALGGDGTMLRAVRELNGRDKPVVGVNLGRLGFLTSLTENDLERAMECLCQGACFFTERSIAECMVLRNGRPLAVYRALNDAVIHSQSARVTTLNMTVNNEEVSHFACDGLIVSTPTGSTGHSLSAGGPVLQPETRAFLVTLICPHTLSTRPLVIPDNSVICIEVVKHYGDLLMTADGQVGQALTTGDVVEIRRSTHSVRFLHLAGYSYFALLRQKLHWRGSTGDMV